MNSQYLRSNRHPDGRGTTIRTEQASCSLFLDSSMRRNFCSNFSIQDQEAPVATGYGNNVGDITTLTELIRHLSTLDDDLIIYAEANPAWNGNSPATVGPNDVDDAQLAEFQGLPEFLDVPLAKEIIGVWQAWRGGKVPTEEETLAALIYYATHDAYMPV